LLYESHMVCVREAAKMTCISQKRRVVNRLAALIFTAEMCGGNDSLGGNR